MLGHNPGGFYIALPDRYIGRGMDALSRTSYLPYIDVPGDPLGLVVLERLLRRRPCKYYFPN